MNYRDTLKVNSAGHLEIGGCDTTELAKQYGTPLYAVDEAHIRRMCAVYRDTAEREYGKDSLVLYASKAFSCKAIYSIIGQEGLGADIVSGGELYTAVSAGFDAGNLYFHGNNKTEEELRYAVQCGVGTIVIDDFDEIDFLNDICRSMGVPAKVLLRVNPGVEAHTHHYIQTSKVDSKFGLSIKSGAAIRAAGQIIGKSHLDFKGYHCHIGSQIFELKPFCIAADIMCELIKQTNEQYSITVRELNLGGGFGIWYSQGDKKAQPEDYADYIKQVCSVLKDAVGKYQIQRPRLVLEPGRAIVGEAGITLYSVGNIKVIENIRKYVSIDGGMFDNPRFALYQAKYSAVAAGRANDSNYQTVTLAGKCCESGDIIAVDIDMAPVVRGDIIAVMSTGAYNYSMASNYNRNAVPPVVLCSGGESHYIVKPQTYEDIARNDVVPPHLSLKK